MSKVSVIGLIAIVLALLVGIAILAACGSVTAHAQTTAPATPAGPFVSASPADDYIPQPWGGNQVRVVNDASNGTQHAAWKDYDEPGLWYSWRYDDGLCMWTKPEVAVSYASADFDIIARDGWVVIAFVHEFAGGTEAYSVRKPWRWQEWSLPTNMSHTSGETRHVRLAVAVDGTVEATWADNTPGYWVVYYALWDGRFWSNRQIPSARGENPSIAVDPWSTYIVYEDEGIRLVGKQDDGWSPVLLVSLEGAPNPRDPVAISNPSGGAWIFWVQGNEENAEVWQARAWFYNGSLRLSEPVRTPMPQPTPPARIYLPLAISQ